MTSKQQTTYAPRDEKNPWRFDTFMNTVEWKEVSRWYPFSLRSLMPDGRWNEVGRFGMRDKAYEIMKALTGTRQRLTYFVIVQCTLVGNDGREKAVVFAGGSEQTILHERARRIAQGWDTPTASPSPAEQE
jgi:hypothetical protein